MTEIWLGWLLSSNVVIKIPPKSDKICSLIPIPKLFRFSEVQRICRSNAICRYSNATDSRWKKEAIPNLVIPIDHWDCKNCIGQTSKSSLYNKKILYNGSFIYYNLYYQSGGFGLGLWKLYLKVHSVPSSLI